MFNVHLRNNWHFFFFIKLKFYEIIVINALPILGLSDLRKPRGHIFVNNSLPLTLLSHALQYIHTLLLFKQVLLAYAHCAKDVALLIEIMAFDEFLS